MRECRYCGSPLEKSKHRYCSDWCKNEDLISESRMESYKDEKGRLTESGKQFTKNQCFPDFLKAKGGEKE